MTENPFYNEPGERENDPRSDPYNITIVHETIRVAYLGMILNPPQAMPEERHQYSWIPPYPGVYG